MSIVVYHSMVVREDYNFSYSKLESIIKDTLGLKVKRMYFKVDNSLGDENCLDCLTNIYGTDSSPYAAASITICWEIDDNDDSSYMLKLDGDKPELSKDLSEYLELTLMKDKLIRAKRIVTYDYFEQFIDVIASQFTDLLVNVCLDTIADGLRKNNRLELAEDLSEIKASDITNRFLQAGELFSVSDKNCFIVRLRGINPGVVDAIYLSFKNRDGMFTLIDIKDYLSKEYYDKMKTLLSLRREHKTISDYAFNTYANTYNGCTDTTIVLVYKSYREQHVINWHFPDKTKEEALELFLANPSAYRVL